MSQTQQTYSLRKEIGFGVELAMSALGEPHQIQLEDQGGAYELGVITTTDALASLRAQSAWTPLSVIPGVLTAVPLGVRKLAVKLTAINDPDAPKPQVFHLPGFFRGTESARYYGIDQLLLAGGVALGAREWDGASWNRFTGVSGVSDGRLGTCSFWMNVPDTTSPQGNYLLSAGNGLEIGLILFYDSVNNQIVLLLKGVGSSNNRMTFISDKVIPGQWQHVMMSWEHTFPIDSAAHMTMYIDGVEITTGGGDLLDQINIDEDLNYQTGSWTQGQTFLDAAGNNPLHGCLSEFYFNTDERIDLTVEANREKFRSASGNAVNIGGDGSGPSGSQPAFYAANGELNPNAGYVPNLPVIAGAILNCATAPTKVPTPPPPPVPPPFGPDAPFLANLDMHYDFTDLSTLWQDEAGTMRALLNGDPIARIDDKGSRGLNLLSSGGTTPLQLEVGTELWSHTSAAVQGVLHAALGVTKNPPHISFCVFNHAILQTLAILFSSQSTASMQLRQQSAGTQTGMIQNGGNATPTNNFPDLVDTWYAVIGMDDDAGGLEARFSIDNAVTQGGGGDAIWAAANIMTIAANANPLGNTPFFGRIAECGVYDIDTSDEPTVLDDLEAYITAKYGIVWAV